MSLLNNLLKLATPDVISQIANYYGNLFPMEIRYNLSDFLERKLLCLIAPNESHPQFEIDATTFMNEFITELELKAAEMIEPSMLPTKMRLVEASQNMKIQNPCVIYSHLLRCIGIEQQILEQAQYPIENVHHVTQTTHQEIEQLKANVRTAEGKKEEWIKMNENICKDWHELCQDDRMEEDGSAQNIVEAIERDLKNESFQILLRKANIDYNDLTLLLKDNVALCHNLTSKVIDDYLKNWQWYQKYVGTDVAINGADLDCIQGWCERLTESSWSTREQIRLVQNYQQQFSGSDQGSLNILPDLDDNVKKILMKLINGSFILEKQPPQVMKTNTKFSTTLRLLVGNVLNIKISNPVVKAQIVSEVQAQRVFETSKVTGPSCGKIINDCSNFEYCEVTRKMTVSFANLKLDGFRRPGKRAAENVTDEKFALFFETNLTIGDLSFPITTMSLPIVVIVHGSQECQAWATIFWDNSFSFINRRQYFEVPDQVTWRQFADALNQKYLTDNDRGLTQENLHFLAEKLFKMTFPSGVRDDLSVSWSAFCKENLQDAKFSFWDWFYSALCVTKEHLHGPWVDNLVVGFINKTKVEEYLKNINVHGTFLLRFSDSLPGRISIAWLRIDTNLTILHIQPFDSKDLAARSLSDRLFDLEELKFLYPNKPKQLAFERFKKIEPSQQGKDKPFYVPAVMKLVVFTNPEVPVDKTEHQEMQSYFTNL